MRGYLMQHLPDALVTVQYRDGAAFLTVDSMPYEVSIHQSSAAIVKQLKRIIRDHTT